MAETEPGRTQRPGLLSRPPATFRDARHGGRRVVHRSGGADQRPRRTDGQGSPHPGRVRPREAAGAAVVERRVTERSGTQDPDVLTFIVRLGAAMSEMGEPSSIVQERLVKVARAFGDRRRACQRLPDVLHGVDGHRASRSCSSSRRRSGPSSASTSSRPSTASSAMPNAATINAEEGLRRLEEIRTSAPRFGRAGERARLLRPHRRTVSDPASHGERRGGGGRVRGRRRCAPHARRDPTEPAGPAARARRVRRLRARRDRRSATTWIDPALRAVVASLVVFLPGATLTTAVLELAAGQIVSGASRLVAGAVQLALLAFGILAGVEAVGVSSSLVLSVGGQRLGDWAPWLGVLVFAVGVTTHPLGTAAGASGAARRAVHRVDRAADRQRRARRIRERVRGRGGDDARGLPRRPSTPGDAGPGVVPARLLAARAGSARSHRADGARRRRRRPPARTISWPRCRRSSPSPSACSCGTMMIAGAESTRDWLTSSPVSAAPRAVAAPLVEIERAGSVCHVSPKCPSGTGQFEEADVVTTIRPAGDVRPERPPSAVRSALSRRCFHHASMTMLPTRDDDEGHGRRRFVDEPREHERHQHRDGRERSAIASTTMFAPVSVRTRMWPTVMSVKTTSAITLPIEAIALRSKNTASSDDGDRGGDEAERGTSRRRVNPSPVGTVAVSVISSQRPFAGYSPAFVAPDVANSAVTVIIQ